MSLKDTINNTNTQKDKLKTGKRNIDNKIISIGGEKAINIADVPNKIQQAIDKNWTRIAVVTGQTFTQTKEQGKPETNPPAVGTKTYSFKFKFKDIKLNFSPKNIKARVKVEFFDRNNTVYGTTTTFWFDLNTVNTKQYIVYHNQDSQYKYQTGILNVALDTEGITFTLTHKFSSSGNSAYGFSKKSSISMVDITASSGTLL